ncbi:2815_t:CDS:1, partial [Gigaspora rosea]
TRLSLEASLSGLHALATFNASRKSTIAPYSRSDQRQEIPESQIRP